MFSKCKKKCLPFYLFFLIFFFFSWSINRNLIFRNCLRSLNILGQCFVFFIGLLFIPVQFNKISKESSNFLFNLLVSVKSSSLEIISFHSGLFYFKTQFENVLITWKILSYYIVFDLLKQVPVNWRYITISSFNLDCYFILYVHLKKTYFLSYISFFFSFFFYLT